MVPPAATAPPRAPRPEPSDAERTANPARGLAVVSRAVPSAPLKTPAPLERMTFTIEFGPFLSRAEADDVERRLNQVGYQTARYGQPVGAGIFGVFIENIPSTGDAQALVTSLREEGFPGPVVIGEREPFAVRVGDPVPLRLAVALAERARAKGHIVRVSAQPGDAVEYVIRHGNFLDREDAERKSRVLAQLGLVNQVVRVK